MKKNIKLVLALVLSIMMVLGSMSAMADDQTVTTAADANKNTGSFSITMTGAEDGHTFTAYKIFEGSLSADGKMGDISWASDVVTGKIGEGTTTIYDELNAIEGITLASNDVAGVVAALDALTDDVDALKKVADVFYDRKGTADGSVSAKTGNNYVISGLTVGYYLVTDEYTSTAADGAATLSRNILAVVGNVTAAVKNDKPEIDKKVLRDTGKWEETNEAGIGETVAYQITGKVPNYEGYVNYFYMINDTLSEGLTFNGAETIEVKIDNSVVDSSKYVVYTGDNADGHTFQIAFKNIKEFTIGKDIVVTYSATVNDKAVIGSTGNPNTVELVYSHNPNDSEGGNPGDNPKPDKDIPTGKTPEEKTITYVAEIDLTKYFDQVGENNKLAGATFTLTGDSTAVKGKTATAFVEAVDGNYYKLADGTYTLTVPHDAILRSDGSTAVESNKSAYDTDALAANKKYKLTKVSEYATETQKVFMQGTSGNDGKITFKGLGAGTYTLKETVTPEGYTTAADIEVVITVTYPPVADVDGTEKATWSTTSPNVTVKTDSDGKATLGVYETDVIDLSGATLPSTGGIGTTIFYVAGSILVLAAAILLITKRRMSSND